MVRARLPIGGRLYLGVCRPRLVWNATGALTLGSFDEVRWLWLSGLLVGALAGGYVGAHFAVARGNRWVKRLFEVLTIGVGPRLLL